MKFKIADPINIDPYYVALFDHLDFEYSYTAGYDTSKLKITKQITKVANSDVERLLKIFKGTIIEYDDTETVITIRKHCGAHNEY